MFYEITKEIDYAILIDEEDLINLFNLISKKYKEIEIIADCKDKTKLKTNNIQEIIAFSNDNFKKIVSLSIYAKNSYEDKLNLDIKIESYSSNVARFSIESDDEEKFNSIRNKLEKWFIGLRQWYNYFSKIEIWNVSFPLLLLSFLTLYILGKTEIYKSTNFIITIIETTIIIFLFLSIILLLLTKPINILQKYIFPRIFFSIGKQKNNLNIIGNIRLGITISLVLAIIIELTTNILVNLIKFLMQ